jgi:hypothetical protein
MALRYREAFETLFTICKENNWGDPFSYARSREIHMACILGHTVAPDYSGADGVEPCGIGVEYKTTIGKTLTATYNGISVQPTWDQQVLYLQNEKIGCYPRHYFARYNGPIIEEMWVMDSEYVLQLLTPKLHKQWHSEKARKDPRLGASLTSTEIKKFGTQIKL